LVFLKDKNICLDPSVIDKFISAEIPDKEIDPIGYAAVQNYMIHGPCGDLNRNSVCMEGNRCTKHFPTGYNSQTTIDEEGFPVYMRRNDGKCVKKGKVELDNRFVVPYSRDLLVKFDAHINVEWCNMSRSVKYLFKYIHKGIDYICAVLKEKGLQDDQVDETKKYLEMRYISTIEACWRLYGFHIHYQDLPVGRLNYHLENEQQVIFPDSAKVANILRKGVRQTKFIEWMEANKKYIVVRELTYADFPTKFVWNETQKIWKERKSKFPIGRLYYAHPSSGEKYHLRLLLNTVKGCMSYKDIRTVHGVEHATFKESCQALGFLDVDIEWIECINESAVWASGTQLRQLFTTIMCNCEVTDSKKLWESTWKVLSKDMQYRRRRILNFPMLQLSNS
jgi:hypothetical protein